jgi:transposase-like protein
VIKLGKEHTQDIKRRQFTKDFKLQIPHEIEAGKPLAQASGEHQLHPNTITKWRKLNEQYARKAFARDGIPYTDGARVATLGRKIGQLTVGNDLLKKAFVAESSAGGGPKRVWSSVASRHHLCTGGPGVHLPGGDPRQLEPPARRKGAGALP